MVSNQRHNVVCGISKASTRPTTSQHHDKEVQWDSQEVASVKQETRNKKRTHQADENMAWLILRSGVRTHTSSAIAAEASNHPNAANQSPLDPVIHAPYQPDDQPDNQSMKQNQVNKPITNQITSVLHTAIPEHPDATKQASLRIHRNNVQSKVFQLYFLSWRDGGFG